MNMVKKIALTASILLFALSQAFSFYVIFSSHQEKIDLLVEKEGKIFMGSKRDFEQELIKLRWKMSVSEQAVTYCFRKEMPEGSALYQGEKELYNSSPYVCSFPEDRAEELWEHPFYHVQRNVAGKRLLVFYAPYQSGNGSRPKGDAERYVCCYLVDVTEVFEKSVLLVLQEALISFFASVFMALLLVVLIKKITKPLEAANEAQRQLIGNMSHELKTPLTAIRGYSETLLQVRLSKEQEEKSLRYINSESERLSRLSEKMMELTGLYEPDCKIARQEVLIEELFESVEHSVARQLEEEGMALEREGDYQGKGKRLDPDLAASFLINLINNSVKASKPGDSIYLGADERSIWVRDEGFGIPGEELKKVRKAFYRVDRSRSRKSGNMGLGLALCEQIAAAHGSDLQMESEVGEGTRVWMEV